MPATYDTLWRRLITGKARGPFAAIARFALSTAAVFYSAAVRLRNKLYDWGIFRVHRLPVPVISVGNITVGGTGKTPFVELVCRKLRALGRKPAILTRGYKAGPHGSDEALMLAEHLPDVPVIVNPDRVAGGREAVDKHGADVLVMDDGFQHRRLHRDLDIVLTDFLHPFGNRRLLPRGPLREPVGGLRRAALIVRTGVPVDSDVDVLAHPGPPLPEVPILRCRHSLTDYLLFESDLDAGGSRPPEALRGHEVFAFGGLGNPETFFAAVSEWGCLVVERRALPDHHEFTPADVQELSRARPAGATLLTTEKDLQRLKALPADIRRLLVPLAVVRIRMEVLSGEQYLDAALAAAVGAGAVLPGPTEGR